MPGAHVITRCCCGGAASGACCHNEGVIDTCTDETEADCLAIGGTWHGGIPCSGYDCNPAGGLGPCPIPCISMCPGTVTAVGGGLFQYSSGDNIQCGVSASAALSLSGSYCNYGTPAVDQTQCEPFGSGMRYGLIHAQTICEPWGQDHYWRGSWSFGTADNPNVPDGFAVCVSMGFSQHPFYGGVPSPCAGGGNYAFVGASVIPGCSGTSGGWWSIIGTPTMTVI